MYWVIVILSFILLLNLIGLLYSRKIRIWSKKEIDCSASEVFPLIADFHEFGKWSPWSNKDPKMSQKFSDNQSEIGSFYSWKGNRQVGMGKMTLTELNPFSTIKMDVAFGRNPLSKVTFEIVEENGKATITWSMEMDLGPIPVSRLLSGIISKAILKDFNQGLINLKTLVENK
jgi:hypothetical protein